MINTDTAKEDFNKWLDFKRVSQKKREQSEAAIDALVDEICEGNLVVNEDMTLVYKLMFPPEGETPVTELTFKPRLKVSELHNETANTKGTDVNALIKSYIAALTGKPKAFFGKLDLDDYSVCQNIAVFFIK